MRSRYLLLSVLFFAAAGTALWLSTPGRQPLAASNKLDRPVRIDNDGKERWRRPPEAEIKRRLTAEQYEVTQEEGTEPPFRNAYWDNEEDGIYVDVVSGEPLFSSKEKFKSGTGWPSFYSPLEPNMILERKDRKLWITRVEVRSRYGDSHLGHVFNDGPEPTGLRYCINSAALRFIPAADLEKEGYGEYASLFDDQ